MSCKEWFAIVGVVASIVVSLLTMYCVLWFFYEGFLESIGWALKGWTKWRLVIRAIIRAARGCPCCEKGLAESMNRAKKSESSA